MPPTGDAQTATERAKFAASELIARFEREIGQPFPLMWVDKLRAFAELGYLKGFTDGIEHGMQSASDIARKVFDEVNHG